MNKATLQIAVDSAKMLTLLGRSVAGNRGILAANEMGRLRARLEQAVYRLVRLGQQNATSPEKQDVVRFIKATYDSLARELGLFKLDVLVAGDLGHKYQKVLVNKDSLPMVKGVYERLMSVPEAATPGFDSMDNKSGNFEQRQAKKGQILTIFGSVVRNDEWMTLLLRLDAPTPARLNSTLTQEYSSGQGRDQRADKVASLVTDKSEAAPTDAGALSVLVALTPKVLVDNVKVSQLYSALAVDKANTPVLDKLLDAAVKPQEVALSDVATEVQARIDALVDGLQKQQKTHRAEVQARRTAAERKREDDAVVALQGMGTHLAVLASNPALLARALEQAGLAPAPAATKKAAPKKAVAAKTTARKPAAARAKR